MKNSETNSMSSWEPGAMGTTERRVTIVTRTKNRPVLLCRALASILSQTYENWHLYVVNDGGECKPVDDLIETYVSAFRGRVTVIHHKESKGMEAAANTVLKDSQSTFVAIHDDDDSWHPEFLEETINFLLAAKNEHYPAVATHCTEVCENILEDDILEEYRRDWYGNCQFIELSSAIQGNSPPPIAILVRRSVASELGYFNESLPGLGNWDFNVQLLSIGDMGVIPRPLAYCHIRSNKDDSAYANNIKNLNRYELHRAVYENHLLRESLRNGASFVGSFPPTLRSVQSMRQDLMELKEYLVNSQLQVAEIRQDCTELRRSLARLKQSLERIQE